MRTQAKFIGFGILAFLALSLFLMTYFTVQQNELTVVTRFGNFSYMAGPGLHFKMPFVNGTTTYRTDIRELSPNKGVNIYTSDNQEVDVIFTVFYRVSPDNVKYIFTNNRDFRQTLFSMTVDRIKATMGQVNVQTLAEKRGELRDQIKGVLEKDAQILGVTVTDFQLTNLEYTKEFRQAVNNAAVSKANVENFEYQRQQAKKQAETAAIQAQGKANAVREAAKGAADARLYQATAEAKAIQLQGEAKAKAIRAQAEALKGNQALVSLRKAERWDGKLPSAVYANAPIPFLPTSTGK